MIPTQHVSAVCALVNCCVQPLRGFAKAALHTSCYVARQMRGLGNAVVAVRSMLPSTICMYMIQAIVWDLMGLGGV